MANVLPIVDLVMAGGWNPDLLLSQPNHDKTFAQLSEKLKRCVGLDYRQIESVYVDVFDGYADYEVETELHDHSVNARNILLAFDSPYSKTKSASDQTRLGLDILVGSSYSEQFYDTAVKVNIRHCLSWMVAEESRLKSDDDMKQVVREVMSIIVGYCRMAQTPSEQSKVFYVNVLRRLTTLYFEIVETYLREHADWREYVEKFYSEQLPLSFMEFTSAYWPEMPSEKDEEAWDNFVQTTSKPVVAKQPKKVAPTAEEAIENEIVDKYNHFKEKVLTFKFFDSPKVVCLNQEQRGKLIRLIVNRGDNYGAYAVAMLCFLEYDKWMKDNIAKNNPYSKKVITKSEIHKHWLDALSLNNERAIKGNYNVIRVKDSKEDKGIYKSHEYIRQVEEDYNEILNS